MNNRDNGLALDSLVWSYRGKTRCGKCFRWHLEVEAHPSGTDIIDRVAPSSFKSTVNHRDDVREPAELQSVFENVKTPFFPNDENTKNIFLQYKGKTFSEWPIDFRELCSST